MLLFDQETYVRRRARLRSLMKDESGVIVFIGNNYIPYNYRANVHDTFRQDSSFLYFFGLNKPGLAAIIDLDSGEDILYGKDLGIDDVVWHGKQPDVAELAAITGASRADSYKHFLETLTQEKRRQHLLPAYRPAHQLLLATKILSFNELESGSYVSESLIKAIIDMRSTKEDQEIDHLDSAANISYEMHTTAMAMARVGMPEQEIVGAMIGIARMHGGNVAFPIILSRDGHILHNHAHGNILSIGDMLLVDGGYETPYGYATDYTRTFPVTGQFTVKQAEIYTSVLEAKKEVEAHAKPGVLYRDMHLLAARVIVKNMKSLGLMRGDVDEAVAFGAHALFFPHGLGHMMGMDVHDMENLGENYVGYDASVMRSNQFGLAYLRMARALQQGFVVTNEPGIYFIPELIDQWKAENKLAEFIDYEQVEKYRDFGGIRIEDDLVITADGCRNLGQIQIPIELSEISTCPTDSIGTY